MRGILVVANWAGGDTRDILSENWYGEFMHLHDFAFVGTKGFGSHVESVRVLEHALQQIASDAHHPELVNAPLVTTGFSAGGGFASRLLVEVPNRVIASAPVGSRLNFTGVTPSAANLGTPACLITGEAENVAPLIEPVLEAYRPQGALFGWATVQGHGHERCGQEVLAMPFLDTVTRLRYPASGDARMGPVRLKPLLPSSGWIADNSTWSSGLASIVPAAKFSGEIGRSSWLPTKDLAFVYRAYATYNRPLGIVSPPANDSRRRVWDPGSNVTIVIDDTAFQGWQKLEFYDGARRLGVVTKGLPQLTATNLQPGYHAFSVLGTDLQGAVRPSAPVLVVVRRLPTDESKVHKGDPIEAPK